MFRIKVCGITNVEDAQMVVTAGADAIGLNFYPKSIRYIPPNIARRVAMSVPSEVIRVGVFANATVEEIRRIVEVEDVRLDLIQLHGDERPEFLLELARKLSRPVIRAFRLGLDTEESIAEYLKLCAHWGCSPLMILVDAHEPGSYGGTGKTADWTVVQNLPRRRTPPVVLAGGLTPENVAEAIEMAHPVAVDVAGGVESSPGHKDARLVEAFVTAARRALRGDYL